MENSNKCDMKYTITVNDNQLGVINTALEWFFRLQMGQFWDFADTVAVDGQPIYDRSNPEHEKLFNEYIMRRDLSREMFEAAFHAAQPVHARKTEDMLVAEDMWAMIRYFKWLQEKEPKTHGTVNAYPPMLFSKEDPILIRSDDPDNEDYSTLSKGDELYCVLEEMQEIIHCTVDSVSKAGSIVMDFTVAFKDSPVRHRYTGNVLGSAFYRSKEHAEKELRRIIELSREQQNSEGDRKS